MEKRPAEDPPAGEDPPKAPRVGPTADADTQTTGGYLPPAPPAKVDASVAASEGVASASPYGPTARLVPEAMITAAVAAMRREDFPRKTTENDEDEAPAMRTETPDEKPPPPANEETPPETEPTPMEDDDGEEVVIEERAWTGGETRSTAPASSSPHARPAPPHPPISAPAIVHEPPARAPPPKVLLESRRGPTTQEALDALKEELRTHRERDPLENP